ncbi:MAG: tetratricopeptide repeat protein [Acidobacteriota bacterium]
MRRSAVTVWIAVALIGFTVRAMAAADNQDSGLQSLLAQAGAAQSRGDFTAAAAAYREAVALDPGIPELWANLGLMQHELGRSSEALDSFQHAIRLKPSLFVPQLFSGVEYLDTGHPEKAAAFLENAVRLNPRDPQAQSSLGKAYAMNGDGARAAACYRRATSLRPDDGSLWVDLGTAYLQQVEEDARRMSTAFQHSPWFNLRAGEIFAEEGKLVQAAEAFGAVAAAPSPPPCAHAEFGITLLRQQKVTEARRQFELETAAHSHCALAPLGLAITDLADGHAKNALHEIEPLVAADRGFVASSLPLFRGAVTTEQVHSLAAAMQPDPGDLSARTVSLLESALPSDSSSPSIPGQEDEPAQMAAAANTPPGQLDATGRYSACDRVLSASAKVVTNSQRQLLAACSFYAGDYLTTAAVAQRLRSSPSAEAEGLYWESKADESLAVNALARAGQISPNSSRMHVLLGDTFRQKRKWGEAESQYRQAAALDPKSRDARLGLGITLFTELKTDEALEVDRALLVENPEDPEANLLAGEILVRQNRFAEARPWLLRCANLKPELLPRLHALLGRVDAETGRTEEAIAEYKLGLPSDEDGSLHFQLGRLYQKTGNRTAAEEAFRESKRITNHFNDLARIGLEESATDISHQ